MGLHATVRSNEFVVSVEADRPLLGRLGGVGLVSQGEHKGRKGAVNPGPSAGPLRRRSSPAGTHPADRLRGHELRGEWDALALEATSRKGRHLVTESVP